MRHIERLIVHCTATPPEWRSKETAQDRLAEVRRWHVEERGWSDIGYHYLIDRDGTVLTGRPVARIGAHTKGHNTGSIGVALFGGLTAPGRGTGDGTRRDRFCDHYTPQQDAALRQLITDLQTRFGPLVLSGHNDHAPKACPCFDVTTWFTTQKPKAPVSIFGWLLRWLRGFFT